MIAFAVVLFEVGDLRLIYIKRVDAIFGMMNRIWHYCNLIIIVFQ